MTEYLEAHQVSDRPLEYHDGDIIPIAEASIQHAAMESRLHRIIGSGTKPGCQAIGTMRVRISARQYVQPDLIVYCGQPALTDESDPSLTNPSVIFEILSPSTAGYDYSDKFQLYRQLPSFEEYVLVAQDQPRLDVFRKMPIRHLARHQPVVHVIGGVTAAGQIAIRVGLRWGREIPKSVLLRLCHVAEDIERLLRLRLLLISRSGFNCRHHRRNVWPLIVVLCPGVILFRFQHRARQPP